MNVKYNCFVFVLGLIFTVSSMAEGLFKVTPYLQNNSNSGISILCIASEKVTGKVKVTNLNSTTPRTIKLEVIAIPGTTLFRCKARIDKLKPGRIYTYRMMLKSSSGDQAISNPAKFKTLNPRADTCRFTVVSDLHNQTKTHAEYMKRMKGYNPDFIIYNGDCWNDPSSHNNAEGVMNVLQAYVNQGNHQSILMKYMMGNHEWRGSFANSMVYLFDEEYLNLDSNDLSKQRYENAFTHGNVRIVFLDTGEDGDKRASQFLGGRQRQVEWLKKEISSPAFKKARWRIIVMHIPAWGNDWVDSGSQMWREVIRTASPKFDLMLGGHTHYSRIWDADYERPFPVVIAGGPSLHHTYIQVESNKDTLTAKIRGPENKLVSSVEIARDSEIFFPINKQEGVERDVVLSWNSPGHSIRHDVYIGTSRQRLMNAKPSSPEFRKRLTNTTSFQPGVLETGKRYFWRVDELFPRVRTGKVREFVVTKSFLRNGSFENHTLGVQADSSSGFYDLSDGVTKLSHWKVNGASGRFLIKKQNRYGLGVKNTDGLYLLNPSKQKAEPGELFNLSQEFRVIPKKSYTVSFDVSYQRSLDDDSFLIVSVNNKKIKLTKKDLKRSEEFVSKSFDFNSMDRKAKISIISNAPERNGFYIDNVTVEPKGF